MVIEAKNFMTLFCSLHKLVVIDVGTKKRVLEHTKIGTFVDTNPEFIDAARFFKGETKTNSKYPVFLENNELIKE
jgi:hypothetical protein